MIEMFNKITRRDLVYVLLILLAFIIGQWASESTVISHFSLAASVASILLALIAIFYTIERKAGIQEQVGRMNQVLTNLESASTRLHEKGDAIDLRSQEFLNLSKGRSVEDAESSSVLPFPIDKSKGYNISGTSITGLLILYWLCKQEKGDKLSSIEIMLKELELADKDYIHGYLVGAELELGAMKILGTSAANENLRAENIPEDLEESVLAGVKEEGSRRTRDDLDMNEFVEKRLKAIDAYFAD
ncbi:hypothetical protein KA005_59535 [bacterium]|nr:hypothetical protein [bacterium]